MTRPPRKQGDQTQGCETVEYQPQLRVSIAQLILAAQGGDEAERAAGKAEVPTWWQ